MTKKETIRTSISFINKELINAAQARARQTDLGNLSMYLQKLILADLKSNGIDIDKIINS